MSIVKKSLLISLGSLMLPFVASAATIDKEVLPENVEAVIELVNLVIAVFAAAYAIKLAALSQGGAMEKTWNWLAIAASLFALLEVNNALAGFGLIHLGGFGEIIELAFALVLLKVFITTRKSLLQKVMEK
ncbi:MAG: hypothetical protein Q8P82_00605 [bacterium]|nr:hypothetical protein [bacterium]